MAHKLIRVQVFEDLRESLTRGSQPTTLEDRGGGDDTPSKSDSSDIDEASSDFDEDEGFEGFETESLAQIALGNVSAAIDRLYRLSFKIRNPATRLGFSNAKSYRQEDPETGIDLIEQFRQFDQRHISEVIAAQRQVSAAYCAGDFLVHRLALANTLRRQQIKKWQYHSIKMRSSHFQEQYLRPERTKVHQMPSSMSAADALLRDETLSVPTTATHVPNLQPELDDGMSQVSISTYAVLSQDDPKGQSLQLPKLPDNVISQKEFECPYCYTLCSRSWSTGKAWE